MTPSAPSTHDDTVPRPSNHEVIETIRAHHSDLAAQLRKHTEALLRATQHGDWSAARTQLHDWYRTELIPHAVAEERTLYAAGTGLDATKLLVQGVIAEHHALIGLIADLAVAADPFTAAQIAASAEALFAVHLGKENDLLLPALNAAGVDLAALLEGMHELLGSRAGATEADGCGCGCGHGHDIAPTRPS